MSCRVKRCEARMGYQPQCDYIVFQRALTPYAVPSRNDCRHMTFFLLPLAVNAAESGRKR